VTRDRRTLRRCAAHETRPAFGSDRPFCRDAERTRAPIVRFENPPPFTDDIVPSRVSSSRIHAHSHSMSTSG
jgi:hypothetical protein